MKGDGDADDGVAAGNGVGAADWYKAVAKLADPA